MGKKGGKASKRAVPPDSEESGLSLLLVILAAIAGGVLLGLYGSYKDQCKLYGIDASHWNPRNATGNIPKWMSYHGTILVTSGVLGLLAVGPLSEALKDMNCIWFCCCCECIAHVLHAVMTGLFGTILMVLCFFLACVSNFIGSVWIYLAGLVWVPDNEFHASEDLNMNRCHDAVFWTVWAFTKAFWFFAFIVIFQSSARTIAKIAVGDERNYSALVLGDLSAGKNKNFDFAAGKPEEAKSTKKKKK